MTPIMKLARRLPELLNRSDRLDDLASDHPEGSPRRDALKHRSSDEFRRACAIDEKIIALAPQDLDDAVVLLVLALEFAEGADSACTTDKVLADIRRVRAALERVIALTVDMADFDLSLIGRGEMREAIRQAAAA
jgi:hypothetical protein